VCPNRPACLTAPSFPFTGGVRSGLESFTNWHFQGPPVPTNSSGAPEMSADVLLPSVLCAVEMALLQIAAQTREVPLAVAAPALCRRPPVSKAGDVCGEAAARGSGDGGGGGGSGGGGGASRGTGGGGEAVVHSHVHLNALLTRGENLSAAEHEPRGPHLEAGAARRRAQGGCAVVKVKVGGSGSIAEQAARVR
jgi:hypothetical protein